MGKTFKDVSTTPLVVSTDFQLISIHVVCDYLHRNLVFLSLYSVYIVDCEADDAPDVLYVHV